MSTLSPEKIVYLDESGMDNRADRQELSQLVYVFSFLIETHLSNPYVGAISEFRFDHDFPRVTEEKLLKFVIVNSFVRRVSRLEGEARSRGKF